MIRIQQIRLPVGHGSGELEQKIRRLLRLSGEEAFTWRIFRQSIDARKKREVSYVYTVDVELADREPVDQEKLVHMVHDKNIMLTKEKKYRFPESGSGLLAHPPVIVGSGPAGLFCAYQLALAGYRPVVLERGKCVEQRQADVERFWESGVLDTASNVQFGEGGAGTFSDGKLNTLVKDKEGRSRYVLETFVSCGAHSGILYKNKPHIGTDVLTGVVRNLREEIIRLGGSFYFHTQFTDYETENGRLCAVCASSGGKETRIPAEILVLAVGHSARDTFETLYGKHINMEAKAFAVGFRVEHPQRMINEHQYRGADFTQLPAASYKVTANFGPARGVYSFCMCPGGYVVNASSEDGHLAVNGMSYEQRDGANANSAIIVSVSPEDFAAGGPLGGVAFQRMLEERAFALGNGKIPQQLYGDYRIGRVSAGYGGFASQTKGAATFAPLHELLPHKLRGAFIRGMERFAEYIPGFDRYDAVLSGVESRTSSPVRILRDGDFQCSVPGIYPCGEGAGYAGGIMSAAMDGMKVAEAVASRYAPPA